MSCSLIAPAEFEPDAGPVPPPYIVWESAFPPFFPTLSYNERDVAVFTVTVGHADPSRLLRVRFCARETAESAFILVNTEKLVEPTPTKTLERKPVSTDEFNICTLFVGSDPSATHYLYVVVTDGAFRVPNVGCDVSPGAGYDMAGWSFRCDKPK